MLSFLFLGGPPPPAPYPDCGDDPTADELPECGDLATCPGPPDGEPPSGAFRFTPLVSPLGTSTLFDARESTDLDGEITTYAWDFGDGEVGSGSRLRHEFDAPGSYPVTLRVTDDSGLSSSITRTFVVIEETHAARFQPMVQEIKQQMRALDAPGVAVAVIEGGELTFAAGFGSRHPERSEPVQPTTLFRIASVTKVLTAVGLLGLVEDGSVDLDTAITSYVPEFDFKQNSTWAPSITPRHLLTHGCAIADYLEIDAPGRSGDTALREFMTGPYEQNPFAYLLAPPGRMYNYTNVGFILSGLVAEATAGVPYRELMRQDVFAPLGMNRTFFLPADVEADGDYATGALGAAGEAMGWGQFVPDLLEPATFDNGWGRPAGYAFSNVLDLAEFVLFATETQMYFPMRFTRTFSLPNETPSSSSIWPTMATVSLFRKADSSESDRTTFTVSVSSVMAEIFRGSQPISTGFPSSTWAWSVSRTQVLPISAAASASR